MSRISTIAQFAVPSSCSRGKGPPQEQEAQAPAGLRQGRAASVCRQAGFGARAYHPAHATVTADGTLPIADAASVWSHAPRTGTR